MHVLMAAGSGVFWGGYCCLLQGIGLLSPPGPTPAQYLMMEERLWLQAAPCSPSPAAELQVPTESEESEGHKAAAVSARGGRRGSSKAWLCQSCWCVVWRSCVFLPLSFCPCVCVSARGECLGLLLPPVVVTCSPWVSWGGFRVENCPAQQH